MKDLLFNEVLSGDRVRFSHDGGYAFSTYGLIKEIQINEGLEVAVIWVEGTDGSTFTYRTGKNLIQVDHRNRGDGGICY